MVKFINLERLADFKSKIISLIPTKISELINDTGFIKQSDISSFLPTPLTTSLAVTEEGVSALDGTVGKVLNDKGSQISLYQAEDGSWHFRNWAGADTVIPFKASGFDLAYLRWYSSDSAVLISNGKIVVMNLSSNGNGTGNILQIANRKIIVLKDCTIFRTNSYIARPSYFQAKSGDVVGSISSDGDVCVLAYKN